MALQVGTRAWVKETGGILSPAESASLFIELFRAQLTLMPEELLHKLGLLKARSISISLDEFAPPDTSLALNAQELCRKLSVPYLYDHCARSYCWGLMFAKVHGLKLDRELFYVAAMLHDMGLCDSLRNVEERHPCFSLISATEAERCMREVGCPEEKVELVCEAITLHLNLGVDLLHGAEAHVLNLATALDTTGIRLWRMPKTAQVDVLKLHPRLGQNSELAACICNEARRFPGTRAAWLNRYVGFSKRVEKAKFPI